MLRVIAVLLLIPLLDVVMLAVVADQLLGWQITVLLVVLTGLLGMLLVRAEGRHTSGGSRRNWRQGRYRPTRSSTAGCSSPRARSS